MTFSKLGIVIPLKAKAVSMDWEVVSSALRQTIDSVLNQSNTAFECVVVGHDKPAFFEDEKYLNNRHLQFIDFDEITPPNRTLFSGEELQLKYEIDRCSKLAKGMLVLGSNDISHWFALDADDLIHKDMIKKFEHWDMEKPVIFDNGYFLYSHINIINKTNKFSLFCGSCCIIPNKLTSIPKKIDSDAFRQTFFGKYSHSEIKLELDRQNISYYIPDDRLIMYVRNHGENISLQANRFKSFKKLGKKTRKIVGMIVNYKVFTDEIKNNFGIKTHE